MNRIDLHVHSRESDGSYAPAELVSYALEKGLTAMALTDHDAVSGVAEAVRAAEGTELYVIPGVELSAEYQGRDIHILGLFLDYQSEDFLSCLEGFKEAREKRNEKMTALLTQHHMPLTMEEIREEFTDAVLTRAHFARMLVKKGYVQSYQEAFERFLDNGKPCYLPKERILPRDAIQMIHQAKGLAVLAHPLLYKMGIDGVYTLVEYLKALGLDGLEAIYSMYSRRNEQQMRELAGKYKLLITGGSDFHGVLKPHIGLGTGRGDLCVPEEILTSLKHAAEKKWLPNKF